MVYKIIKPSNNQTKEWRTSQPWYLNGKHNECEKFQISLVGEITGVKVDKTNKWINLNTNKLEDVKKINILEWTENFDGCQESNGKIIYCNLKIISKAQHMSRDGPDLRSDIESLHPLFEE